MINQQDLNKLDNQELIELLQEIEKELTNTVKILERDEYKSETDSFKYGFLLATVGRNIANIRGENTYSLSYDNGLVKLLGEEKFE